MALIKCPECSGQVSEKATACPHCGCPITVKGRRQNEQMTREQLQVAMAKASLLQNVGCLLTLIVTIPVLVILWLIFR